MRYLSQAWQSIGRVQWRDFSWSKALSSSRKAVALAEKLVNADSSNERYQSLLADNYVHLGTALYKTEYAHTRAELNEALGYYRKALSIHRQLMKTNPEDPDYRSATAADSFWVAATYCSLGDLSGDGEYYQQARESFLTQVELDSALLQSDPTNDRYRRAWADAVICIADRRASLGDIAEVDRSLGEALAVIEAIAAADPTNTEGRSDLVVGEYVLAEYAIRKEDAATARDLARKAAATAETLLREEPDTGATVFDAILSSSRLASVEKSLGRYEGALAAYESALRTANEWLGKKPRDIPTSRLAGMTLLEMGQLHEAMGNWRAAKDLYERSETLWNQVPDDVLPPHDRATKRDLPERVLRCERAIISNRHS